MTLTPGAAPTSNEANGAAIYERGYRSYDGPRSGLAGAIRSLVVQSLRAMMGIGRTARHKVIPFSLVIMAYIPAIVFVGVAALLPEDIAQQAIPSYGSYYGFITAILFLFASFVAPELLCGDRRTGMLGVYLASPLNRQTYLASKTVAIMVLLALITLGPPLLQLIALSLTDVGPESLGAWMSDFWRIVAAGLVTTVFYTAVSMAVSSTTDRKGAAVATTLGALLGSSAISEALVEGGGQSHLFRLVNLLGLPLELAVRIHGESGEWSRFDISTSAMWTGLVAIIVACVVWVWIAYRRLLVRR